MTEDEEKSEDRDEVALDEFHYHEVLDRLSIIQFNLEDFVLSHPVVQQHPELKNLVENASEILADAYQKAGELRFRE